MPEDKDETTHIVGSRPERAGPRSFRVVVPLSLLPRPGVSTLEHLLILRREPGVDGRGVGHCTHSIWIQSCGHRWLLLLLLLEAEVAVALRETGRSGPLPMSLGG
jgi:hypothetical protein